MAAASQPMADTETVAPEQQNAMEMRDQVANGSLSAVNLTQACLQQVKAQEASVEAWAFIDDSNAVAQANMLDQYRRSGRPLGPLHGVPIGIKDIIDTQDMPTENGNRFDTGRQPEQDAWLVERLRAAGAVILGKTVTAECAYLAPGKTRNPHNPAHTPGGSSSGSAAAVAVSGFIGFVGIVVPHTIRLMAGSSYRVILPLAFVGGAAFLIVADLLARTVISPGELPIGVVTAFVGAPFFAFVLWRGREVEA